MTRWPEGRLPIIGQYCGGRVTSDRPGATSAPYLTARGARASRVTTATTPVYPFRGRYGAYRFTLWNMTIAAERLPAQVAGIDVNSLITQVVASARADKLTSVSPFTLEPLAEIPMSTTEDVEMAFETARRAQKRWAQWTPKERARIILRFHDIIAEHRSTTLDLIQIENGKARAHASEEFLDVLLTARHYGQVAPKKLATRKHRGVLPCLRLSARSASPRVSSA